MKCPVDKQEMIVVEYKQIELDYCLQCSGVWFDCGELELLLEKSHSEEGRTCEDLVVPEKAQVKETRRRCPVCGNKMNKAWIGKDPGVLIDSCPMGDGLWFDGGELHQVLSKSKHVSEDVLDFLGETFQAGSKETT